MGRLVPMKSSKTSQNARKNEVWCNSRLYQRWITGIERSLLIAVRAGDIRVPESFEFLMRVFIKFGEYPDRFSGLAGIDPFRGMQGLRDLENAVNEMGFVGAHLYPHWCDCLLITENIIPTMQNALSLEYRL